MTVKTCSRCEKSKPTSSFHKDKRKSEGLTSQCAACRNSLKRDRAASIAMPDGRATRWLNDASNDNSSLPKTRADAATVGSLKYFTGRPCKRGHLSPRYTRNFQCIACEAETFDREKQIASQRKRRETHREEINAKHREDRKNNPERFRGYGVKWRSKNREYTKEKGREKYKKNPEKAKLAWRKRRAQKLKADGFHTIDDIKRINEEQGFQCVYCGASTKERKDIDHIIPLSRGGSDWPSNIQILCPTCNRSKWDRTDEEFRDALATGLPYAANDNIKKNGEDAA